jgi:hypothetical protein
LGTDTEAPDGGGAYSTVITTGAPDGSLNSCGNCIQGTILEPGVATPSSFAAEIAFAAYGTLGDMSTVGLYGDGPNFGGCILAADPVNGKACGIDLMTITACEFAVCLPVCTVTNGGASQSDYAALSGCIQAADSTSCASYITKLQTDCPTLSNDSGTGVFDKCAKLANIDGGDTEAGVATATTETDLFGLMCGGADAGI